ncbi:hypothetical protein [Gottfriedia acidiceleris]
MRKKVKYNAPKADTAATFGSAPEYPIMVANFICSLSFTLETYLLILIR